MSKIIIILTLSSVLVVQAAVLGHACTCPPEKTPLEELAAVNEVFSGVVVSVVNFPYSGATKIDVNVSARWKGTAAGVVSVYTPIVYSPGDGGCGAYMEVNEEYLIYATYGGLGMSTGMCNRTRHIINAQEDLEELGDPNFVPVKDSNWGFIKALYRIN